MTLNRTFATLLLATTAMIAAAQPVAIDKQSPFFAGLFGAPVPTEIDKLLFLRDVMRLAGEHHRAARVHVMAERAVVRGMLGEAPEPAPRTIGDIPDLPPYSDTEFDKLRAEALKRSIGEVANAKNPTPQHRTFRNLSALPVTGFLVILAEPKGTSDIQCRYEGLLAPNETVDRVCPGYSGPRLAGAPMVVRWVRVEPGGYEIKDGKGVFADTAEKTRAQLAALPPAELKPPTPAMAPPENAMLREYARIFGYIVGPGVLLGLLIGAFLARPKDAMRLIHVISAILAVLAGMAGFSQLGGGAGGGGGGGLMLILSFFLVVGAAGLAASVWGLFISGLWLGFAFGYAMRRLALPLLALPRS